jgi:hypothetical protein
VKIAIYTCFAPLFGRLCRSWAKHLRRRGYEVTLHEAVNYGEQPLSTDSADVHLCVAGVFLLKVLRNHGFPKQGRTILWMCDPLIDDPRSGHYWKAQIMNSIGAQFHAVAGMNRFIVAYVERHFPHVTTYEIPFMVDADDITPPLPDTQRNVDVLQLGRLSDRRRQAEAHLIDHGVPAAFVYSNLYGPERYQFIAESKISLNLHLDSQHTYFSQHRVFEAWAAGSLVVSESSGSLASLGIEDGTHLVISTIADMPRVCRELLADEQRRRKIVANAQALLRERYVTGHWLPLIERMIADSTIL